MNDEKRSKASLLGELYELRARVALLERPEDGPGIQSIKTLLQQLPAVVWAMDSELRLVWYHGSGVQALNLDTLVQMGVSVEELFANSDPDHPSIHAHREALAGQKRDFEVALDDGVFLRAHVEPLRGAEDSIHGVIGVALDIGERVRAEAEQKRLIGELQEALQKVKTLTGLIPICVHCKSMRDDKGYWQQVDTFVRDHSEAELSHGICPKCIDGLLPLRDDASEQ